MRRSAAVLAERSLAGPGAAASAAAWPATEDGRAGSRLSSGPVPAAGLSAVRAGRLDLVTVLPPGALGVQGVGEQGVRRAGERVGLQASRVTHVSFEEATGSSVSWATIYVVGRTAPSWRWPNVIRRRSPRVVIVAWRA
ncbi:hypothetical protein A7K94_0200320 [Modestobacter sp. VKM Ac-2676]|nr:hypothetical protein A7K94_0200320 [Modestobacter sp. VKM Ac-2676]